MRLTLAVAGRLSARLETHVDRPLALALSGGGDSMALLHLAADWARDNGRRLLALTVDHQLNAESADWTGRAAAAARAIGADWRGLRWEGPKPAAGLSAAARKARHGLLADAAREAGARVILFAHTADDVAEGEIMRAEGSTLGRLRAWAPSPAWPEGRGLMLMRPLLDVSRADLRELLTERGAAWIEDPANADLRFARARARATPGPGSAAPPPEPETVRRPRGLAAADDHVIHLRRDVDALTLSIALVCAGGRDRPPRGDRLMAVQARLEAGEDFAAVLVGARLEANGDRVRVMREPGEFRRVGLAPLSLEAGIETVWDGRWAFTAQAGGWVVHPAAGRLSALDEADRQRLGHLPPAARAARPVLIRHGTDAPVLAGTGVDARALVVQRLSLALDGMTHERDPDLALHGAAPRNHLFSGADISV